MDSIKLESNSVAIMQHKQKFYKWNACNDTLDRSTVKLKSEHSKSV